MKRFTGIAAIVVALALLALALLAVVPAPTYNLWKLKIIVTECGHFVAPLALLTVFVWRRSTLTRVASALAGLAACLLLIPMLEGINVLRSLPEPRPSVWRYIALLYDGGEKRVVPRELSVAAADGTPLRMEYYASVGATRPAPLVVMIHGGSWQGGDPAQLPALSYRLARSGYAVAAITYRFAPRDTFPSQLDDVRNALRQLRAQSGVLGFDSSRIVLLGRSAGGQLALLAAYDSADASIAGAISFYGPTDLAWGYEHPSRRPVHASRRYLSEYIGGTPTTRADAYRRASPITYAGSSSPPTLLIHGGSDELVFNEHSRRLADALLRARNPAKLITLPWATHGCDYIVRGPCYQLSALFVDRFLERTFASVR